MITLLNVSKYVAIIVKKTNKTSNIFQNNTKTLKILTFGYYCTFSGKDKYTKVNLFQSAVGNQSFQSL